MYKHWLEDDTVCFTKEEEIRIRAAIDDSDDAVFEYDGNGLTIGGEDGEA